MGLSKWWLESASTQTVSFPPLLLVGIFLLEKERSKLAPLFSWFSLRSDMLRLLKGKWDALRQKSLKDGICSIYQGHLGVARN